MSTQPDALEKPAPRLAVPWRRKLTKLPDTRLSLPHASPAATAAIAGLLLLIGGFLAMNALGWAVMDASQLRAPRDILLCAALIFGLPGVTILLGARLPSWLGSLLAAIVFTAFALIPLWIGFGSGPRVFGGNVSTFLSLAGQTGVIPSLGRIVFGGAGLLMSFIAGMVWWAWLVSLPKLAKPLALLALVAAMWWLGWGRDLEPVAAKGVSPEQQLSRHIATLHGDQDFKISRIGGGSNDYLQPVAERWIKLARNRLTTGRRAPSGQDVLLIPKAGSAPNIDGMVQEGEWLHALSIPLFPAENAVRAYFLHDGSRLYFAATVPTDTTENGFDQLRVALHHHLTPDFLHERMHIGRGSDANALRSVETGVKRIHQTHWGIYDSLRSASTMRKHRHFEASVDLLEAGLITAAQFPVYVEVESDPLLNASGKFQARRIEGRSSAPALPLWMMLEP